jgi:dTDP-4-dehydrorhamnose 3,5-epimerase
MPLKVTELEIPGLLLIEPAVIEDDRGWFAELYRASGFRRAGIPHDFCQDNRSSSRQNVLRGIHYQLKPKAQGKLACVLRGTVFDVAVDLRKGSPFYGKWAGLTLSERERRWLWIPPGFGHGFLALDDHTEMLYKVTREYDPSLDRGIRWDDPRLKIDWPVAQPLLSSRDANQPALEEAENNFVYGEE